MRWRRLNLRGTYFHLGATYQVRAEHGYLAYQLVGHGVFNRRPMVLQGRDTASRITGEHAFCAANGLTSDRPCFLGGSNCCTPLYIHLNRNPLLFFCSLVWSTRTAPSVSSFYDAICVDPRLCNVGYCGRCNGPGRRRQKAEPSRRPLCLYFHLSIRRK